MTQQNAASSEESSSAAVELTGQSEELFRLVRAFTLSGEKARAGEPTPQRRESPKRPLAQA